MSNTVKIKEIFTSIQGEGPYIGTKQLFIRFCGCNLSCKYCDTDFDANSAETYSVNELLNEVNNNKHCHSVSLTGGEPLLSIEFLEVFLPKCSLPVYLETNATLPDKLQKIIDCVDYVSADIKLPSCTGLSSMWELHDKFFTVAKGKILFSKVVFDESITDDEIEHITNLARKHDIELILQPKSLGANVVPDIVFAEEIMDQFLAKYNRIRVIPQVHKFLNVR